MTAKGTTMKRGILVFFLWVLASYLIGLYIQAVASAAEPQNLTLSEAVRLAVAQNRALKIARLKVAENEGKKAAANADYFPEITNQSSVVHVTSLENIVIPAGAFGLIPNAGFVPNREIQISQGSQTFVTSGTMATQPLTPLIRIHAANGAASETAASRERRRTRSPLRSTRFISAS
jgi:hypothetical protein